MKKLLTVLVLAGVAAFGLTACDYRDHSAEESIRLGKLCADNGGSWKWSDWSGYTCEIKGKQ